MVPLIFFGTGVIALIELAPRGPLEALMGVGALLAAVFIGYILWSGTLAGPPNTYNLLLSLHGSSSPVPVSDTAMFAIAVILAISGLAYLLIREYD